MRLPAGVIFKPPVTMEDLKTDTETVVGQDARADVQGVMADPKTGKVQAYSVNYLKTEWRVIDPAIKGDMDFLKSKLKGQFAVGSRNDEDHGEYPDIDLAFTAGRYSGKGGGYRHKDGRPY